MQVNGTDFDLAANDLGPLAWVLDELRKSLDSAFAALRRFVRDTTLARGSDMASIDGGHLRIARQQLHQAVGALEMVGLGVPAHMLRCVEAVVQKFVEKPELCNEAAAAKVERAGFALTEYLSGVLLGKAASAVALFPQYRDVQELAGADRIHPADLWSMEWRWNDPETPVAAQALVYDPAIRSRMDHAVLSVIKSGDTALARELADVSLSLAATQTVRQLGIFWNICAGYFEAISLGLLPADVYVKRAATRILLQYAALAKGEFDVPDRLAQDLVFFCSQAVPDQNTQAPALRAVRAAWGLERFKPVDYQTAQYGRFDPVLLAQVRKRIGASKETWSALSGGDATKLKGLADQFHSISDALVKLYPPSMPLAQSLSAVVDSVVRAARPPGTELAMEVATAVLYLEAGFEDLDQSDVRLAARMARLAERLDTVRQGGKAEALEPWMEELYRRVSDRQTMGSVVGELRATLAELEKLLDQFFRNLQDKTPLHDAPGHLSQMRGVLSVLGLDQATQMVLRMREVIEEIIVTEVDSQQGRSAAVFDKLGNNLGALGFLIDMLNYQPALAKKLFVYDSGSGELRPLMGRAVHGVGQLPDAVDDGVPQAVSGQAAPDGARAFADQGAAAYAADQAGVPMRPPDFSAASGSVATAAPAASVEIPSSETQSDMGEDDLRGIFLEEAREVVQHGLTAIGALAANPQDVSALTTLRRAFHTLKGSSRMVGLAEFGEAAWSLEQVLNTWLADQKPAGSELRSLSTDALQGFARWVEDIATDHPRAWKASMFRGPADALRVERRLVGLVLPDDVLAMEVGAAAPAAQTQQAFLETISMASVATESASAEEPVSFDVSTVPDLMAELSIEPPAPIPVAVTPALAAVVDSFATTQVLHRDELETQEAPSEIAATELPSDFQFEPVAATPVVDSLATTQVLYRDELEADEVADAAAAELPSDFQSEPAAAIAATEIPAPAQAPSEVEGIDFANLVAVAQIEPAQHTEQAVPPIQPDAVVQTSVEVSFSESPDDFVIDLANFTASAPAVTEPVEISNHIDEQVKVIGSLRIGIPLYNVYLNEADEWSRRLATEVAEWALELKQQMPDSTVGLAHALAGSSATVGFHALSHVARTLENVLSQTRSLAYAIPQHGKVFIDATEEIRRLLHQFAAGFLKDPDPGVIQALLDLKGLEIPQRTDWPEDEPVSDFAGLGLAPAKTAADSHATRAFQAVSNQTVSDEVLPEGPSATLPDQAPDEPGHVPSAATAGAVEAAVPGRAAWATPAEAPMAAPHTITELSEAQDDIDVADAVDPDLFPIFEEEAAELMPQLGGAMRQWAARPDNRSARDEVLRALHTLKGSARLAGALRLGELAHRMESEIEHLGSDGATTADLEELLQRFDGMQANFDVLRTAGVSSVAGIPYSTAQAGVALAPTRSLSAPPATEAEPASSKALLANPVTTNLLPKRGAANQAVRVRSQLLDRMVNQAGEVMITRSRLEAELRQLRSSLADLTGNLDRLRTQLRDIELQAESQMQSRLAQAKDSAAGFDPLEFDRFTRVQELTRMMAESVSDVATVQRSLQRTLESTEEDLIAQARQTRELQRDLLRTRMVEFEAISDRLYRVIRLASKESGKQVKLDITGGSIELDRGVLDRMTSAFEHLLRNCVAHGIEEPAVRIASGKDPTGTILIGLSHEGNDVSVEFHDDGAGLNMARIREKAAQQGLISPGQALSDQEVANLIFMPGFSTATQVTELSGRGIGMDVVRAEVNALGGRIETTTVAGKGTSFKLVLPLTTAVTQVVMIRSGSLSIGVPANLVEIVRRTLAKELQQAYNSGFYQFGQEQLPFYWSGALLRASQRSGEPQTKTLPVVVFRSAAQRIAVHVDEVLGSQEVVVKNLGPQLARLPGLAGMTVLASGAVVLIYNPVALTAVYGNQARQFSADQAQPEVLEHAVSGLPMALAATAAAQVPLLLVVDDSITVRRVTQRLLQREGYRVSLAVDGLQALEQLAKEKPAVVLSDIEMPRMDGFDLARNIRADARWKDLPIIMITSRIAQKHREHAKELGVDHYLGKPYSEEELLSLVKQYSNATISA